MSKTSVIEAEDPNVKTFSTGVKIRIKPVSSMIIQRAQEAVPLPPVFLQAVPGPNGTVKFADNPNHPDYIERKREAESQRGIKAIEAMILYGVELVDGLPADDEWLEDLGMVTDLQKYYTLNAEGQHVINAKAKKLLYVMNVAALTGDDFGMIASNVIVTEAKVQEEVRSF
jgi:hypothetical protein